MKVLVACEESQTVCKAFRERGLRFLLFKRIHLQTVRGDLEIFSD